MMDRKFCHKCGKKIGTEVNFCPYCGTKINDEPKKQIRKAKKVNISSNLIILLSIIFSVSIVVVVLNNNRNIKNEKLLSKGEPSMEQQQEMNRMMEGILATKKELDEDPQNYALNVRMANNNYDIGRFDQAIKYYKIALSINNNDPSVLIDTGVAFFNLSQIDSALSYMKLALKISPDHPQGLFNVGVVNISKGDSLEAVKYWEKLIKIHDGSQQAESAKKLVETIKNKLNKS